MSRKDKFKRQCVICREFKDKSELYRFTKDFNSDFIELNENSEYFGRSAYVCKIGECIDIAVKKQILEKKLKAKFSQKISNKFSPKN